MVCSKCGHAEMHLDADGVRRAMIIKHSQKRAPKELLCSACVAAMKPGDKIVWKK